jgi:hypothetical protein
VTYTLTSALQPWPRGYYYYLGRIKVLGGFSCLMSRPHYTERVKRM